MIIHFVSTDLKENIKALATQFEVEIEKSYQEHTINIPSHLGNGKITAFVFQYGMNLLLFDCKLEEDMEIVLTNDQVDTTHFHYCIKGAFRHSLANEEILYELNPYMGSISTNPVGKKQVLYLPKGRAILYANLQVSRYSFRQKLGCDTYQVPEYISKMFQNIDRTKAFLYKSNYTMQVSECIKNIFEVGPKGLIRSILVEAKTLELLSLQLTQFKNDHDPKRRFVSLKKYDLHRILKAKDILIEDLKNPPTIVALAKQSGINQQKLKKGFKQVFNSTINEYLRNIRLETARILIMEGNLPIYQVAKEVGYANQSHFARRFREKYGLLPKEATRTVVSDVSEIQYEHAEN